METFKFGTIDPHPNSSQTLRIPGQNMNRSGSAQSIHSVQSAPADLMSRSHSAESLSNETDVTSLGGSYGYSLPMEKCQSMMNWETSSGQDPFSVYSIHSSMEQTNPIGMQNYDGDQKSVAMIPSSSIDGPCGLPTAVSSGWEDELAHLASNPLSPHGNPQYAWSPPYEGSTGTTTPTTTSSGELTTHSTVHNSEMSNHSNTSTRGTLPSYEFFPKSLDVFDFSDTAEKNLEAMSSAKFVFGLNESASSHFPFSFVSEDVYSPIHFPVENSATLVQARPSTVEEMERTTSAQSSRSARSEMSTQSRLSQRHHETLAQSSRLIAPKDSKRNLAEMQRQNSDQKMILVQAQDGSSKHVACITKAPASKPYIRPQHPKILCPKCNIRPEGFRGDHELRRHIESKHTTVRKVWICVDASRDGNFLSSCKHCRNKKTYNAYYNAAAHLRRAHFHPRKRGRKSRNESERRGGKGGGNDPSMEFLKNWMKEIEVDTQDSGDESNESCAELEGEVLTNMLSSSPSATLNMDGTPSTLTARMGLAPFAELPNTELTTSHVSAYSRAEATASELSAVNFDNLLYQNMSGSAENSSIPFSLDQHFEVGYQDSYLNL
jgi:hypothetical protein